MFFGKHKIDRNFNILGFIKIELLSLFEILSILRVISSTFSSPSRTKSPKVLFPVVFAFVISSADFFCRWIDCSEKLGHVDKNIAYPVFFPLSLMTFPFVSSSISTFFLLFHNLFVSISWKLIKKMSQDLWSLFTGSMSFIIEGAVAATPSGFLVAVAVDQSAASSNAQVEV